MRTKTTTMAMVLVVLAGVLSSCAYTIDGNAQVVPSLSGQSVAYVNIHHGASYALLKAWLGCGGSVSDLSPGGGPVAYHGSAKHLHAALALERKYNSIVPTNRLQRLAQQNRLASGYTGFEPNSWICFQNTIGPAANNIGDPIAQAALGDCNPADIGDPLCGYDMMVAMLNQLFAAPYGYPNSSVFQDRCIGFWVDSVGYALDAINLYNWIVNGGDLLKQLESRAYFVYGTWFYSDPGVNYCA